MKRFEVYTNKYDGSNKYKYTVYAKDKKQAIELVRTQFKVQRNVDFVIEIR